MNEDFLAAIGAVNVEFALLEQQVNAAVWSLLVGDQLKDQQIGRLVTADRSFRKNVDLFAALVRHRFPERDSDIKAICSRVAQVEQDRNLIVHSTWALAEEDSLMRIKTTAKGELKFLKMAAMNVQHIAREIHATAEAVCNLHLALLCPDQPPVTL